MGRYREVAALLRFLQLEPESDDLRSRLIVQKVVYIAQSCFGIDLGYKFKWYSRGPYSRALGREFGKVVKSLKEGLEVTDVAPSVVHLQDFLRELWRVAGRVDKSEALEIAASLIMLCRDIYPPVKDPVSELMRRKSFLKRDVVESIWGVVKRFGCCSQEGAC